MPKPKPKPSGRVLHGTSLLGLPGLIGCKLLYKTVEGCELNFVLAAIKETYKKADVAINQPLDPTDLRRTAARPFTKFYRTYEGLASPVERGPLA